MRYEQRYNEDTQKARRNISCITSDWADSAARTSCLRDVIASDTIRIIFLTRYVRSPTRLGFHFQHVAAVPSWRPIFLYQCVCGENITRHTINVPGCERRDGGASCSRNLRQVVSPRPVKRRDNYSTFVRSCLRNRTRYVLRWLVPTPKR